MSTAATFHAKPSPSYPEPSLEFWFEFGSNYSYLSVMRIEDEAARRGVQVVWKPFLLGPVFKALGQDEPPFIANKIKGNYVWRDMERQCRKYGLAWTQPTAFPRLSMLPMRVAVFGAAQPWIGAFCRHIMQMNFVENREVNNAEVVSEVLAKLGLPAAQIIDDALAEPNKLALRDQTAAAIEKNIFGAPTFFARGEMFWGNDRLDDALAFADGV